MSHLLWKYYWENDVDRFRRLLAPAGPNSLGISKSPAVGGNGNALYLDGSPGSLGTSPRPAVRQRKASGPASTPGKYKDGHFSIGRSEVNSRDYAGMTVLLRASSSKDPNAIAFVQALLNHPSIDIYAQDLESGWNALHRSLYNGNVSIAILLLAKEREDLTSHIGRVGQLIKTKDHEGNSPFDLYHSTIAARSLRNQQDEGDDEESSDAGETVGDPSQLAVKDPITGRVNHQGDELFVFGSNKNLSLGVGDEDDRQYPERITLQRPDHLIHRFYEEFAFERDMEPPTGSLSDLNYIPALVRNKPLIIEDVVMSKFHTAVLTSDHISNMYICGVGRGGRLGLGDENTQFKFTSMPGPLSDRKVHQVALGQNHSMAIAGNGEVWTWGLNTDSQLGYNLPPPSRADEEPMSLYPRQVFGPLKKEIVEGIAASSIHSVAHTDSALFCWGRNVGQLALMDADSRSLDVQPTPRKVAASLLSAPIAMVSAIDKATSCLLSNGNVWVFANYGYNLVKFPFPDVFTNHNLVATSYVNKFDPGRRFIRSIASGDETIAAVTASGDLFTMQLNNKAEISSPASSTTNPVKIKGAITQPQCIWHSKKDGVASVSVGEHGSVIICTRSGAVWDRVKRKKSKIANFHASSGAKRNDFKFQRVPYITDCVAAMASTFGAFAAIRKDSKVMTTEIQISSKTLWKDIGSLLCLEDFVPSEAKPIHKGSSKSRSKAPSLESWASVGDRILSSPDIEGDLLQWLQFNADRYDTDMSMRASSFQEICIPVHGWLMTGRSSTLRSSLSEFRRLGTQSHGEFFTWEIVDGRVILTLNNVDVFTLLNIIIYVYQDTTIPVWIHTRDTPHLAHRFRQVRSETMKLAMKLHMFKLETASRLQVGVERSLDTDLQTALLDPVYFEDGDLIVELEDDEVAVHRQLFCQRCPFFEGMFHGRSQGQWLSSRREGMLPSDQIRVDLKHVRSDVFSFVLTFLYGDIGEEMFDDVKMATLDEFSELVIEVLSVANELMIDRLSQICQATIGKFVTIRNIANLLNEISPCSVHSFKDTGLEFICLQLESMLENHLLDFLDEELLQELDEKVRDNQLACLPFAKSGRAEGLLYEMYPELAADVEEERRLRVKEMAFKHSQKEEEKKASSTMKPRFGSLEESSRLSELADKSRRLSRTVWLEPGSPSLRAKGAQGDLIFDMEDDTLPLKPVSPAPTTRSPKVQGELEDTSQAHLPASWNTPKGKEKVGLPDTPDYRGLSPEVKSPLAGIDGVSGTPTERSAPWASPVMSMTKLDLRNIMSETSSRSALTAALAAQTNKESGPKSQTKMSQKERKRQIQVQLDAQLAVKEDQAKAVPWEEAPSTSKRAPWKVAAATPARPSLQQAMADERARSNETPPNANVKPLVAAESTPGAQRRTASPDTRFPGQGRTNNQTASANSNRTSNQPAQPLQPHSKSYMKPASKTESWIGASMADIIGQQKREQELVKEAVAKRSLQEIQQEQAFQEWWDQESRRTQEEEARKQAQARRKDEANAKRGRSGRGRGGKASSKSGGGEGSGQRKQSADETAKESKGAGHGGSSRGKGAKNRGGRGRTPSQAQTQTQTQPQPQPQSQPVS